MPPDGRTYTSRPVDAAEAEERRRVRFEAVAPPPGTMAAPEEEMNPVFPMTLDLRLPQIARPAPQQAAQVQRQGLAS
jgi:uncharacterized protein (DUF2126 family)